VKPKGSNVPPAQCERVPATAEAVIVACPSE